MRNYRSMQWGVSLLTILILILSACAPAATPAAVPSATAATNPPSRSQATQTPTLPPVITATSPAVQGGGLAGTSWTMVSYGAPDAQTPVVSGAAKTTITFGADGQAEGSGGCNGYGGQYSIQGDTVKFEQIISTMMACTDENINRQERTFLNALNTAGKFTVGGGKLAIAYDNGKGLLTFTEGISEGGAGGGATATAPVATTAAQPTATTASSGSTGGNTEAYPYLDDRSTPSGLILSYFNAINRKEYLRAYAYYRSPDAQGTFDQFQQGYQNTASVDVTLGQIGGDAGAGQMYWSVPALLKAKMNDGSTQTFAACYVLHLSNPGIQAAPPFVPMGIERGQAKTVSGSTADALSSACSGPDFPTGQPINPQPVTNTTDISAKNYLDDRSGAVEVLSSLFNAVNRKEYARAYGYWETPTAPFDTFQQGYADTGTVSLTTGTVTGDAGAGQRYYQVPVVLKVQTTSGGTQTFAGCYTLHLANPQIQAALPFHPMGIQSAAVKQVENGVDAAGLLSQQCKK